ncbi:MAG: site-specific integrase [Desulfobaccales bacterium]
MAYIKEVAGKKGITFRVGWRDPNGKERVRNFKKKTPANEWRRTVEYALDVGKYWELVEPPEAPSAPAELALAAVAEEYLRSCTREKGHHIKSLVLRSLLKTETLNGGRPIAAITYTDLVHFKTERLNTPANKKGKPRALSTWNNELAVISSMFKYAKKAKLILANPFKEEEAESLKENHNNSRLRFLTAEEIPRFLDACAAHLRPLVETALLTGLRKGELFGLEKDMIVHGKIRLPGWLTKNGEPRTIPVNQRLSEVFAALRCRNQLKSRHVFCNESGGRLLDIRAAFQGACRRAGIEDFHFHDLRHTFASHLVMNGVPLKVVQELLGHKDIKTTMRYAHLAPGYLEAGVNTLNNLSAQNPSATKTLPNFPAQKERGQDNSPNPLILRGAEAGI